MRLLIDTHLLLWAAAPAHAKAHARTATRISVESCGLPI